MKIRPVVVELFRADGQTDVTMLTVACRNFVNAHDTARRNGKSSDVQPLSKKFINVCGLQI